MHTYLALTTTHQKTCIAIFYLPSSALCIDWKTAKANLACK